MISQKIKEIEKGCGKKWSYQNKEQGIYEKYICRRGELCKDCEVKLQAFKEASEMIEKVIDTEKWDLNEDDVTNQIGTKIIEYSGGVNSVIERHNQSLEKIKQKLSARK